jgi:transforming growth factor-beta-induced protein
MLRNLLAGATLCGMLLASGASGKDIVDTAVGAGSFNTLVAAVKAAGLVDTLKGEGPYTVFAPTDEAFATLPAGTVENLLKPENKDQLVAVLTYHVVPGKVTAADVVKLKGAVTAQGQRADIVVADGKVTVDGANVVKTDIVCDNGVIHVIDKVILPAGDNIAQVAEQNGSFGTLLAAAEAAGLVPALTGKDPLTVFAPTDDAFAKLPAGTVENLLKPENKAKLADILKYHVVAGRVYSEGALKAGKAKTLQGQLVKIAVVNGAAKVNEANLTATDIDASNGVIHVIDAVILPPEKTSSTAPKQVIEQAIAEGSALFNAGHVEECSKVYTTTMHQLLESGEMPEQVSTVLSTSMEEAEGCGCQNSKAWTLRRGLESAYAQVK